MTHDPLCSTEIIFFNCREKHSVRLSDCFTGSSCELVATISSHKVSQEETSQSIRSDSSNVLAHRKPTQTPKPTDNCKNKRCLLVDTPRVGVFQLEPKSLEESLIGKGERGQTFKFGKGKVTKGNVKAARNLLSREFPQVAQKCYSPNLKPAMICFFLD